MNLRVILIGALATLLVTVGFTGLPAVPAAATHPCASGPGGTYDPNPSSDHDACTGSIRPGPAEGTEVVLSDGDSGRTVTLALGQRFRVELTAGTGNPWLVSAGPALHRYYVYTGGDRTKAGFTALSPTTGQSVVATRRGVESWAVTVVVEDRPDTGPSPSPRPCQTVPTPSPMPGLVLLEQQDNGRSVQVERGRLVDVRFYGCDGDPDLQLATATSGLQLTSAQATNPGGAVAMFTAAATGTATITATGDAPCLHMQPACALPQQTWQVTVEVIEPRRCELTGPVLNAVRPGETVVLRGRVEPGAEVTILFRDLGSDEWTARRRLTAASDGSFEASYRGINDQEWFAIAGGCRTTIGHTRIQPTVSGPSSVRRYATVPVVVRGPAGQPVQLYTRRLGGQFRLARTGRLDAYGTYRTSYVADVDHRYYAVTGPDRRQTSYALTQVR